jgi:hypothetical protein
MKTLATLFEILTVIGAVLGGLALGWTILTLGAGRGSDVSLAAGSAFAIALTAIPYCVAGAFHRGATRALNNERA